MFLTINPDNPDERKIQQVVKCLTDGGIIIYPTDTVYGIGCDILNHKAVERVCRMRHLNPEKVRLTFICKDISQMAAYAQQIDNEIFRFIKRLVPGPYTFILKAAKSVPKIFKNRKNTLGVRIPQNPIALAIVEHLGRPILSASLKIDDESTPYLTDPEDIKDTFENQVDIVIDGGIGGTEPSTVVDCTVIPPELVREGLGKLDIQ